MTIVRQSQPGTPDASSGPLDPGAAGQRVDPDGETVYRDTVDRVDRLMFIKVAHRPHAEDLTAEVRDSVGSAAVPGRVARIRHPVAADASTAPRGAPDAAPPHGWSGTCAATVAPVAVLIASWCCSVGSTWTITLRSPGPIIPPGPPVSWIASGVPLTEPAPDNLARALLAEHGLRLVPGPCDTPATRSVRRLGVVSPHHLAITDSPVTRGEP